MSHSSNPATSTSEESLAVTVIPNKLKNAKDVSRKEEEYRQRGSSAEINEDPAVKSSSNTSLCSVESLPYDHDHDQSTQEPDQHLIDLLTKLKNNLKVLWLGVNENAVPRYIDDLDSTGDHRRLLLKSCLFIVKEMKSDWKNVLSSAADKDKLINLEETKRCLTEQLESARAMQSCLQAEINFISKDKANMSEELKTLSMRLAELQLKEELKISRKSSSSSSIGFEISRSASADFLPSTHHIEKRTDDFNKLMDVIKLHQVDMNLYQTQVDKYVGQIKELEGMINSITSEKECIQDKYNKLKDYQTLQDESKKHESIVESKYQNANDNFQSLVESLLTKVNAIETGSQNKETSNAAQVSVLERGLQSAKEENNTLKEEVSHLKCALERFVEKKEVESEELENKFNENQGLVQELAKRLTEKVEDMKELVEVHNKKEAEWNEHRKTVSKEKENLEHVLEEKDFELRRQIDILHGYEKRNLRQEKRVQDMHKCNGRLKREIQELKKNMESLNNVTHQLRSSLNEQKVQWTERIKAVTNDALQAKDTCRWLQTQVEHLNSQIIESQDRVKAHEKDKCNLALQILAIDEERKLVDEKLQELRSALQGDSPLRETLAVAERSAVCLQKESNRPRRTNPRKLGSLSSGKSGEACAWTWDDNRNDNSPPPSEMGNNDQGRMPMPMAMQMTHISSEKGVRKLCVTNAALGTSSSGRRVIVVPRAAVSLTSPALNTK